MNATITLALVIALVYVGHRWLRARSDNASLRVLVASLKRRLANRD